MEREKKRFIYIIYDMCVRIYIYIYKLVVDPEDDWK